MDYRDSADEAAFREKLKNWLSERAGDFAASGDEYWARQADWHRALYAAGFFGLSWPREYGGRELPPVYDVILDEELARAGAPPRPSLGYLVQGLGRHGSEELRRRFLPGMINGTERWCQGFSEPGAGSDLASLRTFAERSGDGYSITGQKLWTSGAQFADWCLLLARTARDGPKHQGISAFTVRMSTPGITVRPFKQAWGGTRFCEVFLDGAEVPVTDRVGEEGDGWPLATVVLAYERGPSELGVIATYRAELRELVGRSAGDAVAEDALARAYVAVEACRLHLLESLTRRVKGEAPGPGTSVDKLLMIRAEQALGTLELDAAATAGITGEPWATPSRYLWSRAASVYGGSEQIQRNIVAQRVLGLPRR